MGEVKIKQNQKEKKGGDVVFTTGTGAEDWPDGSFIWKLADGTEAMRIDPDGSFFVKGERAATQLEVYEQFKEWLRTSRIEREADGG
jgi:hypothetical protein